MVFGNKLSAKLSKLCYPNRPSCEIALPSLPSCGINPVTYTLSAPTSPPPPQETLSRGPESSFASTRVLRRLQRLSQATESHQQRRHQDPAIKRGTAIRRYTRTRQKNMSIFGFNDTPTLINTKGGVSSPDLFWLEVITYPSKRN